MPFQIQALLRRRLAAHLLITCLSFPVTENDFVSDILERLATAVCSYLAGNHGVEQSKLDQIAQKIKGQSAPIRVYWKGCIIYIPGRLSGWEERKRRALEDARRTGQVSICASKHGVSRATLYRLLKGS